MLVSRRALLPGAALVGLLTISPALLGRVAYAATPTPAAAACSFTLPSSHNLRVLSEASGVGLVVTLSGGGYTFTLERFKDIDASVRQAFGVTPPNGDAMAPFSLKTPSGHYYAGLANVVRQGVQYRVCLRGAAYRDLTNAFDADRTPPVAVTLDGAIGTSFARVDLQVGFTHYYVYGHPHSS